MIPLPQTPWTLAIAELLGLRMATAGSGAQPADLLANLLPNREPVPEGLLEYLLAQPIPGYTGPVSLPGPSTSPTVVPVPGSGELPTCIPTPGSAGTQSATGQKKNDERFATLWEHTLKCMALDAKSEGDVPGSESGAGHGSESCDACGRAAVPGTLDTVIGGRLPPRPPSSATMDACFTPNPRGPAADKASGSGSISPVKPPNSSGGSTFDERPHGQVGDDRRVSIDLTLDVRKLATDLYKLAKQVAEDVVGRHQVRMGAQTRANLYRGRR